MRLPFWWKEILRAVVYALIVMGLLFYMASRKSEASEIREQVVPLVSFVGDSGFVVQAMPVVSDGRIVMCFRMEDAFTCLKEVTVDDEGRIWTVAIGMKMERRGDDT